MTKCWGVPASGGRRCLRRWTPLKPLLTSGRHVETVVSGHQRSRLAPLVARLPLVAKVYSSTASAPLGPAENEWQQKKINQELVAFFASLLPARNTATMHPDRLQMIPKGSRPQAEAPKPAAPKPAPKVPKTSLFDNSDESDDGGVQLKLEVNSEYAKRFEYNKKREERSRRAYTPCRVPLHSRAN